MEKKEINKNEEKNKELKEKIDVLQDKIEDKTKELKEDLTEKSKQLKKDFEIKSKELKKEISEKSEDLKEDIKEKAEELKDKAEDILKDVKNSTKKFDKKDIEENKAMACLAYIVAPVPYFIEEKSKWVRYHAIQGMNFFIIFVSMCLAVSIINSLILFPFPFLKGITRTILYSFGVIYALIGIINVCNGEAKELPIINKFKFIKK